MPTLQNLLVVQRTYVRLLAAVCVAVPSWIAISGCESTPIASSRAVVTDVTPENNSKIILDETTVDSKVILGEAPAASEPAAAAETSTSDEASPLPKDEVVEKAPLAPAVSSPSAPEGDYRLAPGDVLAFRSFDDELLSQPNVTVRYDGYISLPLVPDIKVEGHTRQEAEDLVRAAYTAVFQDPQLTLVVVQALSKSYYVMGDIRSPNEYPYTKPISVLEAIQKAGGLAPKQNSRNDSNYVSRLGQLVKAFVIRHHNGEREILEVDLQNLMKTGPHPSETPVYPSDIVFVPEGMNLVYVLGEVGRQDVMELQQGMTLVQLLAAVAGPNFTTARLSSVVLMRPIDDSKTRVFLVNVKQMLRTGQQLELRPGDIVYVPRKPLVTAQEFVARFTGSISPLMSLYTQAYDTYYTRERFDRLFDDNTNRRSDLLGVIQDLQTIGGFAGRLIP